MDNVFLLGDGLRWIGDGSRVDRGVDQGWIGDGSRRDRGKIKGGLEMDQGWIGGRSGLERDGLQIRW